MILITIVNPIVILKNIKTSSTKTFYIIRQLILKSNVIHKMEFSSQMITKLINFLDKKQQKSFKTFNELL